MKRKKLLALIGGVLCLAMLVTVILPSLFSMAAPSLEVLNPWGEIDPQENLPLAERSATLTGGKIGLIYFDKLGGPEFTAAVKAPLQAAFSDLAFEETALDAIYAFAQEKSWYDAKSGDYDAVVISFATDSTTAYWGAYHAREFEKRGVPAVVVATSTFEPTLALAAEDHGITALRSVVIPINTFISAQGGMATKIVPIAATYCPALINAITAPLTASEAAPDPIIPVNAQDAFAVPGSISYEKQLRYFNNLAMDEGFSDGLPLTMPTRAAVDEMLAGTERAPDEVLGKLRMRYGICTIEKIAINAVMAGAKPEYFPVIIAAMEALCDGIEDKSLFHAAMTTGDNYMLMLILSGPLAKELDFATDRGYSTPGRRNNTTIGRAVNLAFQNIAHNTKPYVDTSRYGRHQDHTGLVFTENVAQTPFPANVWQTHGESMGFAKEQSSITVVAIGRMGIDDNWINNEPFGYNISELLIAPGQQMLRGRESYLRDNAVYRLSNIPTNPTPSKDIMILPLSTAHASLLLEQPETDVSTAYRHDFGQPISPNAAIGTQTGGTTKTKMGHLTGGTKDGLKEWFTKNGVKTGTTGANASPSTAVLNITTVSNPDIPFAASKNILQPIIVGENPTYELIFQSKYLGTSAYRTQLITGATLTEAGADATAPGTPKDLKALSYPGKVTLAWSAPDRTNGAVTYEVSCDDGATWLNIGDKTSYIFTGIDNADDYRFVVRAVNDADNARVYDEDIELSDKGSGRGAWAIADVGIGITSLKIDTVAITSIPRNSKISFAAIVNAGASTDGLVWRVSDTSFAIVDSIGNVTILNKMGMVTLTAIDPETGISHSIVLRIT